MSGGTHTVCCSHKKHSPCCCAGELVGRSELSSDQGGDGSIKKQAAFYTQYADKYYACSYQMHDSKHLVDCNIGVLSEKIHVRTPMISELIEYYLGPCGLQEHPQLKEAT